MDKLTEIVNYLTGLLQQGGYFAGFLLILLESIIPALPLGVFIAFNINAFGIVIGILISWCATCFGSYLSYKLFSFLSNKCRFKFLEKRSAQKVVEKMKNIEFSSLVIIISLPFTPAFAVNIASGLVNMNQKKYLLAILIGKIFIVIFWGFVGKSFLESMTDIKTLFILGIFVIVAYFISKIVSKKMKIE